MKIKTCSVLAAVLTVAPFAQGVLAVGANRKVAAQPVAALLRQGT